MPVSSYQSPNDYNLVKDIHPFEMPYQSMMQEIATKGEYWKIGANRIKSIYDQATDLDPQYSQGREYLKSFMNEANTNLQKLSKSDLSVMDNSQQAANVFKPLFDVSNPMNASLLMDSQLNKFYKKQEEISNQYRTKDGGKEWNQNNEFYFRSAQQKYMQDAQSGDYSTIQKNFQNKKAYIPYYDYKKELTDLQDACKGYSQETQDVSEKSSMYMQHDSHKGCDPQRLALAFQTGLSDRAKQQMRIDGFVHYQGNEDTLLKDFHNNMVGNIEAQVNAINAKLAGLKAGKVGTKEQSQIDDLTGMLSVLNPKLEENLSEYNNIIKGNGLEYVKNNYEKLAGALYFDRATNQLGEAYRTDENKKLLTPNAVAMLEYKTNAETASQMRQFTHDDQNDVLNSTLRKEEDRLKLKGQYDLAVLKGEIKGGATSPGQLALPGTSKDVDIPKVTEQDFKEKQLAPAQAKTDSDYKVLTDYITQKYQKDLPKSFSQSDLIEFINQHNSKDKADQDPKLTEYYNRFEESNNRLKSKINMIKAVDAQVKAEHPNLTTDEGLDPKKVNLNLEIGSTNSKTKSPISISEKDMYKVLKGESVNGITYRVLTPEEKRLSPVENSGFFVNGQYVHAYGDDYNKLQLLKVSAAYKNKQKIEDLSKYKTDKYTTQYYNNGDFTTNELNPKKGDEINEKVKGLLGVTGDLNEKNGYTILYRDRTGQGMYVLPLDENGKPVKTGDKTDPILKNIKGENDALNGIVPTYKGNAYYISGIAPRYANLPGDMEISKNQSKIDDIANLKSIVSTDKRLNSSSLVDSKSFEGGVGTITMKTNNNRPAVISIRKEGIGANAQMVYVATIQTKSQGEKEIEADTPEQLITLLNSF